MTQEFLNTELKPYNALTREEKYALLDAALDGNVEQFTRAGGGWNALDNNIGSFVSYFVYRTKPKEYKKLDIPWQVIDEKWKWATFDSHGIWLFENKPTHNNIWYEDSSDGEVYCVSKIFNLDTTGIIAEHSLTERPE